VNGGSVFTRCFATASTSLFLNSVPMRTMRPVKR
jgi:hypothetical protein